MQKFLICLSTGRPHFEKTIRMLSDNITKFSSNQATHIGLLINYDIHFKSLTKDDFIIEKGKYAFDEISYFGEDEVDGYIQEFTRIGLTDNDIRPLVQTYGYGNRKNLLFLYALVNKYDYILFCDDDEYPISCTNDGEGKIKWIDTDYIGGHLAGMNEGADITFGFWSGYISPIPTNIISYLPKDISYEIGKSLKIGTDVIDEYKFSDLKNIFHISDGIPPIQETLEINGSKLISGGNSCFRTKSILEGIIPPFYFPKDTRGDDSIMSMRLSAAKVYSVPAGIFHDCFQDYIEITERIFPERFDFYGNTNDLVHYERFYKAFVGWLSYTPFLMKLRYKSNFEYFYTEMITLLHEKEQIFLSYFPELKKKLLNGSIVEELNKHKKNVYSDFDEMISSSNNWKSILDYFFR